MHGYAARLSTIADFRSAGKGCRVRSVVLAILIISNAAYGADLGVLDDASLPGRNRYERCLELTRRIPQEALKVANTWQTDGGGPAAGHCAALALVALKLYPEAAKQLDQLGHSKLGSVEERADLFDQAGNAWLLARRAGEAIESFSSALALSPRDPDLLADRARAAAMLGDWKSAENDLSAALKLDPNRADLLVLRASARHAMGHKAESRADLEAALRIVPNYSEALLERGTARLEAGDLNGARSDWQTVVSRAPGSEAATTAEERLKSLQSAKSK
jgi:tetratricopeptide (TPR) repeat protein